MANWRWGRLVFALWAALAALALVAGASMFRSICPAAGCMGDVTSRTLAGFLVSWWLALSAFGTALLLLARSIVRANMSRTPVVPSPVRKMDLAFLYLSCS